MMFDPGEKAAGQTGPQQPSGDGGTTPEVTIEVLKENIRTRLAKSDRAWECAKGYRDTALKGYQQAGLGLIELRKRVPKGGWTAYLKNEYPKHRRTAYKLIELAKCAPGAHLPTEWARIKGDRRKAHETADPDEPQGPAEGVPSPSGTQKPSGRAAPAERRGRTGSTAAEKAQKKNRDLGPEDCREVPPLGSIKNELADVIEMALDKIKAARAFKDNESAVRFLCQWAVQELGTSEDLT